MLSWPRKIRSKVVPLKGSIKEPNLQSKNLLQPSINRTRHNLNPTWGSGGISSICRVPVSSTFWQWCVKKVKLKTQTCQLRQLHHLSSLWLGREDETSLSCSFTAIKLKYLPPGLQSMKKRLEATLRDEIMFADLRPNCGGSLTAGATALAPIFNGFSSLKTDHSHHIKDYLIWVVVPTVWDL